MADETDGKLSKDQREKLHKRALARFDDASLPQMEIRAHALLCRRFIAVPGAMWEDGTGETFENAVKLEIDKLSKGVEKIVGDYRKNRIVPDFKPAGGTGDQETADTLDGIHRADNQHFKSSQARDNAFEEAVVGGFGAYRLANDYADPSDKDSDEQRVNPGLTIADADQRVFFDPNSKLYDKSDARYAFVLTAEAKDAFEEEYDGKAASDWPDGKLRGAFDWFTPDVVIKAEYYEVETRTENLLVFTHRLTDAEERWWEDELDREQLAELKVRGWVKSVQKRERKRVRKVVMSGAEVIEDCGFIAGDMIPIVPVYGKRSYVDNVERFRGFVSKRMDAQRLYNLKVSKSAEIDALSPREKPIFAAEQMPAHLAAMWANQEKDRHPYALVNPLLDPVTGGIAAAGPIGKIEPPTLPPVTAMLLQIAAADLNEETEDGADEVVANTSADAMDIAATRIDAKSDLYLDNMRQSVQREGEIYLGMARDCYFEQGRVVETMSVDGDDGEAVLAEPFTDESGVFRIRNDFSRGKYKVIAGVTEATATRRDKTVKSMLGTAAVAQKAGDNELAQVCVLTAIRNQDGEGMGVVQEYSRKRLVAMGVEEPNEEEKAEMEAAGQTPDPTALLAEAQAIALKASAAKDASLAEKAAADTLAAKLKPVIDGYNAETQRIKAFTGKENPLGAAAEENLGPVVERTATDPLPANDTEPPRPRIRMGRELMKEQA